MSLILNPLDVVSIAAWIESAGIKSCPCGNNASENFVFNGQEFCSLECKFKKMQSVFDGESDDDHLR